MSDLHGSEEQKLSKINPAALINLLLLDIWKDFYRHMRNGKYIKANNDLDCLWVEFGSELKDKDPKKKIFVEIEKKINEASQKLPTGQVGFQKVTKEQLQALGTMYRLLLQKADFLKKLQNAQGKGTAYRDSSDDYMDV